ncbi:MAG: OmpA family protein [Gammaproteobacteria bacterium]|nr:OmpA family protein [Gammaproteobacteria bacterium]
MRAQTGTGRLAGCVAGMLLVTACSTLDPYTREGQTSQATKGAAIGAGIGVVAGLITGDDAVDRRQRALIGGGLGALTGAAVGNYMDRQEAQLRQRLDGTGVSVHREGDNITLLMPGNVTFRTDSAALNQGFFDVLNSVGLVLEEYEKTVIEVAGHTDSRGSDSYNQDLSEERASTVAEYLRSQGIMTQRIITVGQGEGSPVASNDTEQGRQQNRRVELTLVPLTA